MQKSIYAGFCVVCQAAWSFGHGNGTESELERHTQH